MKDLVKQLGESRINGNGDTPPGTPPRKTSRSSSPRGVLPRPRASRSASPLGEKTSQSSSPLPIPGKETSKGVASGRQLFLYFCPFSSLFSTFFCPFS